MQTSTSTVNVVSGETFFTDPSFTAARQTLEKCLLELSLKNQELRSNMPCSGPFCCCCSYHAMDKLRNWAPAVLIPCILCCPTQTEPTQAHETQLRCSTDQSPQVIQDPALCSLPAQLACTSTCFELLLDVHDFHPHEIRVTIKDDSIEVGAERTQPGSSLIHSHSVLKRYRLPYPVKEDLIQCSLSKEGILFLTAPWKIL